ncbi:MAG: response regulator [Candidatus Brocadiae bacterium]|nr:response regulator [Candidatus Brocadiia bacterium]
MHQETSTSQIVGSLLPLVLEQAPEALLLIDTAGIVQQANARAHGMFGYGPGNLVGVDCSALIVESVCDRLAASRDESLRRPTLRVLAAGSDLHGRRLNGDEFPIVADVTQLSLDGGPPVAACWLRDPLTLRESELRLHTVHLVARIMASARTIEEAAPRVLRSICEMMSWQIGLFWVSGADAPQLRLHSWWAVPEQSALAEFGRACLPMLIQPDHGIVGHAWNAREPEWVEDVAARPEFRRQALAARFGLVSMCVTPVVFGGRLVGAIEFFTRSRRPKDPAMLSQLMDIGTTLAEAVDRIRFQEALQLREQEVRRAENLEAVGRLAGGIAHDFNNLLTAIVGYSEDMATRIPADSPLRADLLEIRHAGDQAAVLTRQLLAFGRKQILQPRVVDPAETLAAMEPMLRSLAGESVALSIRCEPGAGSVHVDPGQLEQVIVNLVLNARESMPRGGRLELGISRVELQADDPKRPAGVPPGSRVLLTVADSGAGFDETTQAHLFEPFYNVPAGARGTGLGLATVYGIVQQSGGHIQVESRAGLGATFRICFPRVSTSASPLSRSAMDRDSGHETILLVEDEQVVRRYVRTVLKASGYRVLEAGGPEEALQVAQAQTTPIHLVITDVVMPDGNGRELSAKLAVLFPAARFLFMSGHTEDAIVHDGILDPGLDFLGKPFKPKDLLEKVRAVLSRRP